MLRLFESTSSPTCLALFVEISGWSHQRFPDSIATEPSLSSKALELPPTIFPEEAVLAADRAREELGQQLYDEIVQQGRRMTMDEVAAFMHAELRALSIPV